MNEQDSLFKEPRENQPDHPATSRRSSSAETSDDLREQVQLLQHQLTTVMILLLVVTASISVYLYPQVKGARRQLIAANKVLTDYNDRTAPQMKKFIGQLGEYAKAHPEVLPILTNYGLIKPADAPASAPTAPPGGGQ